MPTANFLCMVKSGLQIEISNGEALLGSVLRLDKSQVKGFVFYALLLWVEHQVGNSISEKTFVRQLLEVPCLRSRASIATYTY